MAYDSSLYNVLMEFEVLVPLCLSVIVVIAVLILLYMVVTKRTLNRTAGLFDHNATIVDPLTGCVSQTNKTNPRRRKAFRMLVIRMIVVRLRISHIKTWTRRQKRIFFLLARDERPMIAILFELTMACWTLWPSWRK